METEGKKKGAKVKATIWVYSVGNPGSEEYESGIWIYKEQLKIVTTQSSCQDISQ